MPGPPSWAPTVCAPMMPAPASICPGTGIVIRNPRPSPTRQMTAPSRTASVRALSAPGETHSTIAATSVASHSTAIDVPMTDQTNSS